MSNTKTYYITVDDVTMDKAVTSGFGDRAVLGYLARYAAKVLNGSNSQVSVAVYRTEKPGDEAEPLVVFTGDAETAGMVLKAKVAKENAANGGAPVEPEADKAEPATH